MSRITLDAFVAIHDSLPGRLRTELVSHYAGCSLNFAVLAEAWHASLIPPLSPSLLLALKATARRAGSPEVAEQIDARVIGRTARECLLETAALLSKQSFGAEQTLIGKHDPTALIALEPGDKLGRLRLRTGSTTSSSHAVAMSPLGYAALRRCVDFSQPWTAGFFRHGLDPLAPAARLIRHGKPFDVSFLELACQRPGMLTRCMEASVADAEQVRQLTRALVTAQIEALSASPDETVLREVHAVVLEAAEHGALPARDVLMKSLATSATGTAVDTTFVDSCTLSDTLRADLSITRSRPVAVTLWTYFAAHGAHRALDEAMKQGWDVGTAHPLSGTVPMDAAVARGHRPSAKATIEVLAAAGHHRISQHGAAHAIPELAAYRAAAAAQHLLTGLHGCSPGVSPL